MEVPREQWEAWVVILMVAELQVKIQEGSCGQEKGLGKDLGKEKSLGWER